MSGRAPTSLVVSAALALLLAPVAAAQEPLDLAGAVQRARSQAGTLRIRALEVNRTRDAWREALSRALPQVGLTATGTWLSNPQEGITLPAGSFGTLTIPTGPVTPPLTVTLPEEDYVFLEDAEPTYFQVSLGLDQVLWSWGKIERSIRVAALDREAAAVALEDGGRSIEREVSRAYFAATTSRDAVTLLAQAEELARLAVEDRELDLAEGTVVRLDVLEARSAWAAVLTRLAASREGLETALAALEYHTGVRPDPASLVTPLRVDAPELDEAALASAALATSAELRTTGIRTQQARYARDIRRASLLGLPDFSLKVTVDVTGQDIPFTEEWTDGWDTNVAVTLAGHVTLWDSLSSVWKLEQAASQLEQAAAGEEELRRGIRLRIRTLVGDARNATTTVAQRSAERELAAERARSTEVARRNEMATRGEERQARMLAIAAELALLEARLELEYDLLELEYATGRGLGGRGPS